VSSHIGIVGVSPEGAALFYRQVTRHALRALPANEQPRISLHNEPVEAYISAIRNDDWHTVGKLLRRSAELLARCGADFCLTPDNAVQHGVQLAEVGCPIPWLTMTELVAEAVASDSRKAVGIIGTKLVMFSSTYQTHLGLRGIQVLAPDEAVADQIDRIIFEELVYGQTRPESRLAVLNAIGDLARKGCEGVILASSEASLLVTNENSPLPVYDSSEVLAEASVRRSIRRC
jgi:aspartate racemase